LQALLIVQLLGQELLRVAAQVLQGMGFERGACHMARQCGHVERLACKQYTKITYEGNA
jgi:hypothetical protein